MTTRHRYVCPACQFAVFNRRVAQCESCGAALPASVRFTPEQLVLVQAEHRRTEAERARMAAADAGRSSGGAWGLESAGWPADGGGGDGGGIGGCD